MTTLVLDSMRRSWEACLGGVEHLLPRVLAMLVLVSAGWIMAVALRWALRRSLAWLRIDALAERAGIAQVLKAADLPRPSTLVGSVAFWFVWLGFILLGVTALEVAALNAVVSGLIQFVPRLLLAALIAVAGTVVAHVAWRATLLAAVNAKLPSARLLARAARMLILILTGAMALEHIAVAQTVVMLAFAITFGAVMLGLAIAFGIGGSRLAGRALDRQFPERPAGSSDEVTHL